MSLRVAGTQVTMRMGPKQKFWGHSAPIRGVIHLPGGQQIVTCSIDGSIRVWNLQTGKQIATWVDGGGQVESIAISPDEKKIVSGWLDGGVRLWDIETGQVAARWTGHSSAVGSLCWTPDSERVLSGSWGGITRVWDIKGKKLVLTIKTGLSRGTTTYSPDVTMIASGGVSNKNKGNEESEEDEEDEEREYLKIFDAKAGELVAILKGHTKIVVCIAWTADGTTLISGSNDRSIRMWDTSTWRQVAVLTGHLAYVCDLAISPNGRILASVSQDDTVRFWNLENAQRPRPLISSLLPNQQSAQYVSFSPDGKTLVTGDWVGDIYTWDISHIYRLLSNPTDPDQSLLSADATRQRREVATRQLHPGFFDEPPRTPTVSTPPTGHNSRPHFLEWAKNTSFKWLPRRVDVPLAHGNFRNYSAGELRMKRLKEKEEARQAKNAKNNLKNSANSAAPSGGGINQQSTGTAQVQPPSNGLRPASSTSSTTAASPTASPATPLAAPSATQPTAPPAGPPSVTPAATTSTTLYPNTSSPQARGWARFICCAPPQDTNDDH